MEGITGSQILFYGGIGLMALAVIIGIVVLILFRVSGKRLRKRLEEEYGKKRH